LAGEIETHLLDSSYDFSVFLPKGKPQSVVLGCTHYIYLKKYIESFYGCKSYDGNTGIARRVEIVSGVKSYNDRDKQPLATPTTNLPKIVYLGECGGYNKHIYEQMFAK
jgi:glutamate racemase